MPFKKVMEPMKAWKSLAILDPKASFGVGNSKSNSLLWTASLRPDSGETVDANNLVQRQKNKKGKSVIDAQCNLNSACDTTGALIS